MQLNVNTDAVVKFSDRLERLSRSAFPVAVRSALNSAAFDVKTNTMPRSAANAFIQRRANFFKATSKVQMAQGFNVNNMHSIIGFQGTQQAVDDLEQQEHGGTIGSRGFIAMNPARSGSSPKKMVRANARLKAVKIHDAKKAPGKNDKEKFVRSVIAAGKGGHVLSEWNGKMILWRVNSLNKTASGTFKLTPLYTFERGRKVSVNKTGFMKVASLESGSKLEQYFIQQAERQFEKALR